MKRLLSLTLVTLLIIVNVGCNQLSGNTATTNVENQVKTDDTYYSVTNAYTTHDKNFYMELDVKIPKIEYSNEDNDALIDPINEEILNTITELIENAKSDAMDTYEVYLSSAEENIKIERDKRIKDLKSKYKNIIGTDEVKAIANVMNTEITREMDFRGGFAPFRKGAPFFRKASGSDIDEVVVKDKPVNGFTNTEIIIDPNLHNKNIIIKQETTANETRENETIKIEGRPGKKPQIAVSDPKITKETIIETTKVTETAKIVETESIKETEATEVTETETTNVDIVIADVEKEEEIETLTLDDFYRELKHIEHMTIPSKSSLTRAYIPTYIYCDFDVKCLDEDYLSLYIELSESRTTEKVKTFFYNIDLKNKKVIGIKDILGENYKENCINTINAAIDNWDETKKTALNKDYDISKFINDDTKFFVNNNHKPVVVFDKYSIGSSALSYPEFVITKK